MYKENYPEFGFPNIEGIDVNTHVVATYLVSKKADVDIVKEALSLAGEQTVTTWTPTAEVTREILEKYLAKVIGINEVPNYETFLPKDLDKRIYIFKLAFPIEHFRNNLPLLLSFVVGNISALGEIKLIDIMFPKEFVKDFKGPKFGIEGVRNILKVPERPLILNMIKPCTGIPVEVAARLFYEAAKGGTDVIKDDELMGNPDYSRIEDRVVKFMEKADSVEAETGEKTLYTVNITTEVSEVFDLADKAIENGANALMVNAFPLGLTILRKLAEDPSIKVPILAHPACSGVLYSSPVTGISSHIILGKLLRLCGTDLSLCPGPFGKFPQTENTCICTVNALRGKFHHLRRSFPGPGGGCHPGCVPWLINNFGFDIMVAPGGAIHGHPDGSEAGAKAHRQAIEATMKKIPLEEYAESHPELKRAIEIWGSERRIKAAKPF